MVKGKEIIMNTRALFFMLLTSIIMNTNAQVISSVSPSSSSLGEVPSVTISGTNLNLTLDTGINVWLSQGTNTLIQGTNTILHNDNEFSSEFILYQFYPQGYYDVTLYSLFDGTTTLSNGFYIGPDQISEIINISPSSTYIDSIKEITIETRNTHFLQATNTAIYLKQGTSTYLVSTDTRTINGNESVTEWLDFSGLLAGVYDLSIYNLLDGMLTKIMSFVLNENLGGTSTIVGNIAANNKNAGASSLILYLVDNFGDTIQTTITDIDGNFSFENIPYGEYFIYVDGADNSEPIQVSTDVTNDSVSLDLAFDGNKLTLGLAELNSNPFFIVTPSLIKSPFSINYKVKSSEHIKIEVVDILGKQSQLLVDRQQPSGDYSLSLNAENVFSISGMYMIRFSANGSSISKKIIYLR